MARQQGQLFCEVGQGRGIRCDKASSGIEPGTLIVKEEPYAYTLTDEELLRTRCHYCLKRLENSVRCDACRAALYCNEECKKAASFHHRPECRGYSRLMGLPEHLRVMGRILYKMHARKTDMGALGPLSSLVSNIETLKSCEEGIVSLDSKMDSLAQHMEKDALPDRAFMEEIYGKIASNSFAILDENMCSIGIGVYPQASMINHSCQSNCIGMFYGPQIQIRANEYIRPGEQIFHGYIPPLLPTAKRQEKLLKTYHFLCQCADCRNTDRDRLMRCVKCPDCSERVAPNADGVYEKCEACGFAKFDADFYEEMDLLIEYAENILDKAQAEDREYDLYFLESCLAQVDFTLHSDNVYVIRLLKDLVEVCVELSQWEKAVQYGKRMEPGYKMFLKRYDLDNGLLYQKMALAYYRLGDQSSALPYLRLAKATLTITSGEESGLVQEVSDLLAECVANEINSLLVECGCPNMDH
ncbi:PREDICTED: N-lysine methyltransferase SMYD2-like [Branchiostoma belcheri]|uniref:[histone H3]-lysine(4) N-trimethyltransferase n=1 Tax=Branchiostoma belcheri TaxID=7741 RepID=A0A6P4Z4U6_BRABE|nr:PREDICTED: N-lysine methyltransferase SMYD2-like [Branchiostoma belcheri]